MRTVIAAFFALFLAGLAHADALPNTVLTNGCILQGAGGGLVPCSVGGTYGLVLKSANLGALGDAGSVAVPTNLAKYYVTGIIVTNCSATPVLAQLAIWTGAGGTGTNAMAAGTITGATGTTIVLPLTPVAITLTAASLFIRTAVANAAALTCDVYVTIRDLS